MLRRAATWTRPPPTPALGDTSHEGQARKGRGAGRFGGRATGRGEVPSGLGRRAPSSPHQHRRRRRLCASRAEMGAKLWAAQWHLARAVGKRFRGCRAKRLYVYFPRLRSEDALAGSVAGCQMAPTGERKK